MFVTLHVYFEELIDSLVEGVTSADRNLRDATSTPSHRVCPAKVFPRPPMLGEELSVSAVARLRPVEDRRRF
jgi:hypothetical protein